MEKLELKLEGNQSELTVRKGEAPKIPAHRKGVKIEGVIGVPVAYLKNPPQSFLDPDHNHQIPKEHSYLIVDRENMAIRLVINAGAENEDQFIGKLVYHELFLKFGINKNVSFTAFELADLIKMNRTVFDKNQTAMKLVSQLRDFRTKVDRDVEMAADDRGNKKLKIMQAIETNIPESFKMELPVFKDQDVLEVEVEVVIDANDFSCRLVSPEAADYVQDFKNKLIDEELEMAEKLIQGIQVFEV